MLKNFFRLHVMLIYLLHIYVRFEIIKNEKLRYVSWYELLLNYIPKHRNLFVHLWLFNDVLSNSYDVQ